MPTETSTRSKLTYADYIRIPEDGMLHEIINGAHYMNPAPNSYHQTISRRIQFMLYSQIEQKGEGVVYDAPYDVQLSPHDIVQPDIVVVLSKHMHIITPTKIKGTPDLVIEILSPSSEERDRQLKKDQYRAAGVPEYWIVDPCEHAVEQFVLENGNYKLQPAANVLELSVLPNVKIRLEEVW
jgi:Uma2 family endonuclease